MNNVNDGSPEKSCTDGAGSPVAADIGSLSEVERLTLELQYQRELVQHWKSKAILGADYQDAQRYRWLRKDALNPHTRWVPRIGVTVGGGATLYRYVQNEQEFDASLDAVRNA